MSKRSRIRLSAVTLLLLGYFVIFWGIGCSDYLILHPSTYPITVKEGTRLLLDWPQAQAGETRGKLEVWTAQTKIRRNEENLAYVLEFSPNAGRAEYGLMYGIGKWEGLPIEYWSLNYPGYGQSTGPDGSSKATLANVHQSALAAYDLLAARAGGKPIFVSGYSLGTAAALYVAANRPVAGVYLYSPPPLRQMIRSKWWYLFPISLPVAQGVPAQLGSLENGAKCTAPAVFVLGRNDTFVNHKYQRMVYDAYSGPKTLLEYDITHNDLPEVDHLIEVRGAIYDLWTKTVGKPDVGDGVSPTTQPTPQPLP